MGTDLRLYKELTFGEDAYLKKLKKLVEVEIPKIPADVIDDPFDVFGRIDLIYQHHQYQFRQDLNDASEIGDIIEYFVKHRHMFFLYKDFIKVEPYLFWLNRDHNHELKFVKTLVDNRKMSLVGQRLTEYLTFIITVRDANLYKLERCEVAVNIIKETFMSLTIFEKDQECISEFLNGERRYINNLKENIQKYENNIFKETKAYDACRYKLYGKLPEIYEEQTKFFIELDACRYDMDIVEIMQCFLKYKSTFELYVDDRKLRVPSIIEKCQQNYNFSDIVDFTFDRIFKYPQFLQKFKEIFTERAVVPKIVMVENMFKRITKEMDDIISVNEIMDANIDLATQGKLRFRGKMHIDSVGEDNKVTTELCTIFLFDKSLIFTQPLRENGVDFYMYKKHIMATNIKIGRFGEFFQMFRSKPDTLHKFKGTDEHVEKLYNELHMLTLRQLEQSKTN